MLRLFSLMGTGGAAWAGVRASSAGVAAPTMSSLSIRTIRFLENNRIKEALSLPQIPIYTAPWWGLAGLDVDIRAGDVYTNGTIAFLVTGQPDTSQGFLVIPAAVAALPRSLALQAGAGYQAGLRIGAW
jgi:hypothetical protein